MRGDSLRDLYAKALALVGLGLLAAAGAMVDYWPVLAPLPEVAAAPRIVPDAPPPVVHVDFDFDTKIPAPVVPRPAVAPPAILAASLGTADFLPGPPSFLQVAFTTGESDAVIDLPEAALPVAVMPITAWLVLADQPAIVLAAAPAPVEPSGFLGGALRKTKESIIRTGVAAGSSIADAFRGVFGAFRKVSPF